EDLDPDVPRRLVAEGVDLGRQVEIVVDGFGDVNDPEAPGRLALDAGGREGRVVTADGDEVGDVEPQQRQHRVLEGFGALGGVGTRDPDEGAAPEVDAARVLDGQAAAVLDVALHDPFEAVLDAEHLDAFERGTDGRGADHGVDAGRGSAADEDGHAFAGRHELPPCGWESRGGEARQEMPVK